MLLQSLTTINKSDSPFLTQSPNYVGHGGAFSHSAGTAPIITLFIPGTPLKTTPLQKPA